jgi:hypothetical protein
MRLLAAFLGAVDIFAGLMAVPARSLLRYRASRRKIRAAPRYIELSLRRARSAWWN